MTFPPSATRDPDQVRWSNCIPSLEPVVMRLHGSPHRTLTWAFYPVASTMRPSQTADMLLSMASGIDASRRPSAVAVASDIEAIIAAMEARTAWSFFKSKGVKKTEAKIKALKSLIKATKKLVGELRSGEDFSDLSRNPEFVKALHGASKHVKGGSDVLEALSHVENETDVRELMAELDGLYEEDDDSELGDRKGMVSALEAFVTEATEKIQKLQDRLKDQEAEAKKGKKLGPDAPTRDSQPKSPTPSMFSKLKDRARGKMAP